MGSERSAGYYRAVMRRVQYTASVPEDLMPCDPREAAEVMAAWQCAVVVDHLPASECPPEVRADLWLRSMKGVNRYRCVDNKLSGYVRPEGYHGQ